MNAAFAFVRTFSILIPFPFFIIIHFSYLYNVLPFMKNTSKQTQNVEILEIKTISKLCRGIYILCDFYYMAMSVAT